MLSIILRQSQSSTKSKVLIFIFKFCLFSWNLPKHETIIKRTSKIYLKKRIVLSLRLTKTYRGIKYGLCAKKTWDLLKTNSITAMSLGFFLASIERLLKLMWMTAITHFPSWQGEKTLPGWWYLLPITGNTGPQPRSKPNCRISSFHWKPLWLGPKPKRHNSLKT